MKILTLVGTRPEIIRLSGVIGRQDGCAEHVPAHTGQNRDPRLSGIFFEELGSADSGCVPGGWSRRVSRGRSGRSWSAATR